MCAVQISIYLFCTVFNVTLQAQANAISFKVRNRPLSKKTYFNGSLGPRRQTATV